MVLNLPTEFIRKYQQLFQDRYNNFEKALFNEPIEGFRLNPLKENYTDVKVSLEKQIPYSEIGYYGRIDGNSIDHISGYLYSQDPSAMYVAEVLNPQPGEKVLDLCAAPGSKTTYLGSKMANKGVLVANEINTGRAKVLSSNVERMGLTNTVVVNNSPDQLVDSFSNYFDRIVVDAPCSGEGMFRKDHEATQYWSPGYVEQCATRQKEILKSAYKLLKPGGTLVYSTCTFSPEEDELTALWFADEFDLEIIDIKKYEGMESGNPAWCQNDTRATKFLRMFPDSFNGEGHFISKFIKPATETELSNSKVTNDGYDFLKKSEARLFSEFAGDNLNKDFKILSQNRDKLESPIINVKSLHGVKVLRNGLRLGTFKKNRFEPDHALVLALPRNAFKNIINLNDEQYQKYVHGDVVRTTMDIDGKWVGVSYQNKVFSWGKYANQTIKNFFPKGLRI